MEVFETFLLLGALAALFAMWRWRQDRVVPSGPSEPHVAWPELIPNAKLTPALVPEPGADWPTIFQFSHTFDPYRVWRSFDAVADIANTTRPARNLTELRTCLFFEARRWRHFGEDPYGEYAAYIRGLVEHIRARVVAHELE